MLAAGLIIVFAALAPRRVSADTITGGEATYVVRKGDTIELVGARLAVDWRTIVRQNGIDIRKPLTPGQQLKVDTRRIIPAPEEDGLVINIPDRTLYFFTGGRLELFLPVGLGKPPRKSGQDWSTPVGKFTVVRKAKNPTWYVPESIQEEMEAEGKPVKTLVPPGPDNPLGKRAIKTSLTGILLHETIWPSSVYQYRSHGCIRMMPEHMEQLFSRVEINAQGRLIYLPVKAARSENGRVFLEVRRDVYGKIRNMRREAKTQIERLGASSQVDWNKVERALKAKAGIPEDVTL